MVVRRLSVGVLVFALLGVMAGCTVTGASTPSSTAPVPSSNGPTSVPVPPAPSGRLASSLGALIQQILDQGAWNAETLTPYARDVLERSVQAGSISATDYEAAHNLFVSCLAQYGFEQQWKKGVDGVYVGGPGNSVPGDGYDNALAVCSPGVSAIIWLYSVQQSNPDLYSDQFEQAVACLRRGGLVDASYTAQQLEAGLKASPKGDVPFDPFRDPVANACLASAGFTYINLDEWNG